MARKKKPEPKKDFEAFKELPARLWQVVCEVCCIEVGAWMLLRKMIERGSPQPYRRWTRSKGKGKGVREFHAPYDLLKEVQRGILIFLQGVRIHSCVHGNVRGRSTFTNAYAHQQYLLPEGGMRGCGALFAVDIANAFPTTFRSRIRKNLAGPFRGALELDCPGIEYSEDDRAAMLEAVIDLMVVSDRLPQGPDLRIRGKLPQGPPTSPRIFDLCCRKMDKDIATLLQQAQSPFQQYRVTRWVDNYYVSTDGESMPEELRTAIMEAIKGNGYHPHEGRDKVKYYSPATGAVPVVSGLVLHLDGSVAMVPDKRNQVRGKLSRLASRDKLGPKAMGQMAGLMGYVKGVYPKGNYPSDLRKSMAKAQSRLDENRLRRHVAALRGQVDAMNGDAGSKLAQALKAMEQALAV